MQILASLPGKIKEADVCNAIIRVGLDLGMKKPVSKYSPDMRQRLGHRTNYHGASRYLILDEPFNDLDKRGITDMRNLNLGLRNQGKTVLLASHNTQDIDMLCETVCEMDAGILRVTR